MLVFLFNYMRKVYYEGHDLDEWLSPAPSPSHPAPSGEEPEQTAQAPGQGAQQVPPQGEPREGSGRGATGGSNQDQEHVEGDRTTISANLPNIPTGNHCRQYFDKTII